MMANIDKLIKEINQFADQKIKESKSDFRKLKGMIYNFATKEVCTVNYLHISLWALITFSFCFSATL